MSKSLQDIIAEAEGLAPTFTPHAAVPIAAPVEVENDEDVAIEDEPEQVIEVDAVSTMMAEGLARGYTEAEVKVAVAKVIDQAGRNGYDATGKTVTAFAIEDNVPLPTTRSHVHTLYPFGQLEVGQSFVVPFEGKAASVINTRVRGALQQFQRRTRIAGVAKKFISSAGAQGIRVWRTE